jgi:hypothetical protein
MCGGLVVSVPVGACLGALAWHLGLCRLAAFADSWGVASSDLHSLALALSGILFVQVFVCWGRVAGPANFHRVLVPLLAGLYCAVGCGSLLPAAYGYGLGLEALMAEAPCAHLDSAAGYSGPLCFLAVLVAATAAGVVAHTRALARKVKQAQEKNGNGTQDLVQGLLPASGEGRAMERPSLDSAEDRFSTIVTAVQDPDFDLSTLDDTARGVVEVCRKDEEEKYRLFFGGGLL